MAHERRLDDLRREIDSFNAQILELLQKRGGLVLEIARLKREQGLDGYDVIDWKTGTKPSDPVQLAVYRLGWAAVAAVDPSSVTAGFYVVREGRVDRPELPDAEALAAVLGLRA